jgi:DNA-binding MarR family transcriptional regulator
MSDTDLSKLVMDAVPQTMAAIRTEMRAAARDEMTVPQFRLLVRLSRTPSTNADLAEWMGISAPTMSRMVDTLVNRHLIKREVGDRDRREVKLTLTSQGDAKYNQIRSRVAQKFSERFTHLSNTDVKTLSEGLALLRRLFA